jgi:hypothetical protein
MKMWVSLLVHGEPALGKGVSTLCLSYCSTCKRPLGPHEVCWCARGLLIAAHAVLDPLVEQDRDRRRVKGVGERVYVRVIAWSVSWTRNRMNSVIS